MEFVAKGPPPVLSLDGQRARWVLALMAQYSFRGIAEEVVGGGKKRSAGLEAPAIRITRAVEKLSICLKDHKAQIERVTLYRIFQFL